MKKISILIPCYNEEENVVPMSEAVVSLFETELAAYDYELVFIDNDSKDHTRKLLRGLCAQNQHIKVIFNAKNFGQFNSPYYGMLQSSGDCTVLMAADFQEPVEMVPKFVKEWENGYLVVMAKYSHNKEDEEEYIDLIPILEDLYIDADSFVSQIKEVRIRYD